MKNTIKILFTLLIFMACKEKKYTPFIPRVYGNTVVYKSDSSKIICIAWDTVRGKKNHGQVYCVCEATVTTDRSGKKDTVGITYYSKDFSVDEYNKYVKLSVRGRHIVDSLKEDGITQFQNSYLANEPNYMKTGKKKEYLWTTQGDKVVLLEYLFWHNDNSSGCELINEIEITP